MDAKEQSLFAATQRRSTTLKDVAKAVGLSESTASVVLNGARSGTRVSERTRKRVLDAADRLGYHPNAHARGLSTGRSNRVGIYSGRARVDARNHFFASILGGVLDGAETLGLNCLVHGSSSTPADLRDLVSSQSVDGLLVHLRPNDPMRSILADLGVPAITLADRFPELPAVCVDDEAGGRLQAQHLARLGHRRVLLREPTAFAQSARDRMDSFRRVAENHGIEVVSFVSPHSDSPSADEIEEITRPRDRATAVVCWNDATAELTCRALSAIGLRVPEDVSVVGFDGFQTRFALRWDLTTIRAPWEEVGATAVRVLHQLIHGEPVPRLTVLPVEFHRGATTDVAFCPADRRNRAEGGH
ncbi:MAG: LacI family DNA-binding transcriptional regulator [Fimbriimonadaceae bacterium]|nr:LacI family DNA-binding transcriptional regulator [Fimbriimonadaceae bacterium]